MHVVARQRSVAGGIVMGSIFTSDATLPSAVQGHREAYRRRGR